MARFLHLAKHSLLICVILFLTARLAWAQKPDPVAKSLGLTPDQKALPVWTNPKPEDRAALSKVMPTLAQGIFLVGNPKSGFGTAWVLSREHRLLVTNAHVADIRHRAGGKMFAIRNDTAGVFYTVEQVWYHPGVRRRIRKLGDASSLSSNPADGEVDALCPDVAVLQLSKDPALPALPVEFQCATSEDLKSLPYQAVGMVGFPGHDTRKWPDLDEKAKATYHDGVISRLSDFRFGVNAEHEELQFVQHTASSWPGFSGSPIFLPNGRVVAIHNSATRVKHPNFKSVAITIPYGIRVDCLWELLVHHKLDSKVPQKIDKKLRLNLDRWLKPDKRDKDLRRAVKLVEDAAALMDGQKFSQAIGKCNEAKDLAREYPWAYRIRGAAYLNYYYFEKRAPRNIRIKRLVNAFFDAFVYSYAMGSSDPEAMLFMCAVLVNFGNEFNGNKGLSLDKLAKGMSDAKAKAFREYTKMAKQPNRNAFAVSDKLLTSDNLTTPQRARAYSFRGSALYNLGNAKQALQDHKQATRLDPGNYMLWENRAEVYDALGFPKEARAFRAEAEKIRERQKRALRSKEDKSP